MDIPIFPEWHKRAACAGSEAYCFFPPSSYGAEVEAAKEAREKFCNYCPVIVKCLESALVNGDVGIWAGMTTYQRNQIRRKKNRVKCPICLNKKLVVVDNHSLCLACGISWDNEEHAKANSEVAAKA